MKPRIYTDDEQAEIGRKVQEARDWSMITGQPLPLPADVIARLEVNGYTVDLLTGAITRDGEIAVIRDSERASPPTDAANALVATWQRAALATAGAVLMLALLVQSAAAAPRCPNGGQPDGRGRCTYIAGGDICGSPLSAGGHVCRRPAPPSAPFTWQRSR